MAKVPDGRSLVEKYASQAFAMIGVNTDDPSEDLAERTAEKKIPWRSFVDGAPDGPITTAWGVNAFPTTYLIDHEGVVRFTDLQGAQLEEQIDLLLEAAAGS